MIQFGVCRYCALLYGLGVVGYVRPKAWKRGGSVDVRFGEAGDVKVSGSELWWKVTAMESHGDFLLHLLRLLLPQCSGRTRTREMITVMVCESMG